MIEEALLTYQAGKPLYLASALGGVTKALCDAILQRRMSSKAAEMFYTPSEAAALFAEFHPQHPVPVEEGPSLPNSACDALAHAANMPVESLAQRAALSTDDYLTLMTTPDVGRALQLVGLSLGKQAQPS